MNQGNRRGDFVRVIYSLWGENTQLLGSDSTFIEGSQIIYKSGIVTDSVLEPNQSAQFSLKVAVPDSISVTYITRDVRWEIISDTFAEKFCSFLKSLLVTIPTKLLSDRKSVV